MSDIKEEFLKHIEWSRQQFESWWITENGNDIGDSWNAKKRTYLHEPVQACYRSWKASHAINLFHMDAQREKIRTQQATIERLTEQRDRLLKQLAESQRELIEWDTSLRISAELLGDSKPTRLPIQKIINMNKALIAEIEAENGNI